MVIRRYPPSDLNSVDWFYSTKLIRAKKRAWKRREYVLQKLVTEKWNAGWQFSTKKHEKIHKMCRNDLRAFALRNYSEGFKTNKPLSGLLLYWRIMPKAARLSEKWTAGREAKLGGKLWNFEDNLSAEGIILRHTSQPSITFIISPPPPALLHKKISNNNDRWVSPTKQ